jgi:alpha-amylase/alpha-mannosidase (GH57 family)
MEKCICIHGHFYQPPRENPWLEAIEYQPSAAPYHDWNERITAECYYPNATARILDSQSRIQDIINNYSKISFNFGPTLLAWMKDNEPEVHQAIVTADKLSRQRFSGHGSAIAQVYNHMILPLGHDRDKLTQVIWGIRDFEYRFHRPPEGMWLAETAADLKSLDALAQCGIKFTILAPSQANRFREIGSRNWRDVNGAKIDPTRAYRVSLPSGRSLAVFFYDGPISTGAAFERVLNSGERFAHRLLSVFSDRRNRAQLVHVATDGETYGHHHRHGEMALAYALQYIENVPEVRLSIYGEFLEKYPPTREVQIHEKSSWSCSHGVGRWMANCGCNSGGYPQWNQNWRAPLRQALDWLRDEVAPRFEKTAHNFLKEPWDARNDYISVILDRSPDAREKFYARHAGKALGDEEKITVLKLMELQRHAMLMYTSCGWFFDELSGIETVQVIAYAGRVVQLAKELFAEDLEPGFLERLSKAKSNIPEHKNGRVIYEKWVKPEMIDWKKVVAHYAGSSVFETYEDRTKIYVYEFEEEQRQIFTAGRAKLSIGRPKVTFDITRESERFAYAVMYLGEHNMTGGVARYPGDEAYQAMVNELKEAFERADFPQVIRLMDRHFGESCYSLKSLFKDEQKKVLDTILSSAREDLENRFRLITERYTPLMRFLKDLGAPYPPALQTASDFILRADLGRAFAEDRTDLDRLRALCDEAKSRSGEVFDMDLAYQVTRQLENLMRRLAAKSEKLPFLQHLEQLVEIVQSLPLKLNLERVQNTYYAMLKAALPEQLESARQGNPEARAWTSHFLALGEHLNFALPASSSEFVECEKLAA